MWGRATKFGQIVLKNVTKNQGKVPNEPGVKPWRSEQAGLMPGMCDWAEGSSSYFLPTKALEQLGKTGSMCQPGLLAGDTAIIYRESNSLMTMMGSESRGVLST